MQNIAKIEAIIVQYATELKAPGVSGALELELRRYNLQMGKWMFLYNQITTTGVIEENELSTTVTVDRKRPEFKNQPEPRYIRIYNPVLRSSKEIFQYKTRISDYVEDNYKISLTRETPVVDNPILSVPTSQHYIRIRFRSIISNKLYPNWRFHFSAISNTTPETSKSQKIFYSNADINNFRDSISKIQSAIPNSLELELEVEYSGPESKPPEIAKIDIKNIVGEIIKISEYLDLSIKVGGEDSGNLELLNEINVLLYGKSWRKINHIMNLLNKPVSFTKSEWYSEYLSNIGNYFICDKNDGIRALIYVKTESHTDKIVNHKYIITSGSVREVPGLFNQILTGNYIFDAEYFEDPGTQNPKVIVFDMLMCNGINLTPSDFKNRYDLLLATQRAVPGIVVNNFTRLTPDNYKTVLAEYCQRVTGNPHKDGIILTPATTGALPGPHRAPNDINKYLAMRVLKWKPEVTLDFLVLQVPKRFPNSYPYIVKPGFTTYLLFCGVQRDKYAFYKLSKCPKYDEILSENNIQSGPDYFPIQFQSEFAKYDAFVFYSDLDLAGHVCEFAYDPSSANNDRNDSGFRFIKIRHDKDVMVRLGMLFGNDLFIAKDTFMLMRNPVTVRDFIREADSYFVSEENMKFTGIRRFNLFAKSQIAMIMENFGLVVDLACGRGADMNNYLRLRIQEMLLIDQDNEALETLMLRYTNRTKQQVSNTANNNKVPEATFKNIRIMNIDLSKPFANFETIVGPEYNKRADGVVINFALHYLIHDEVSALEFIEKINYLLKLNGIFIATFFDARKIYSYNKSDIQIGGNPEYQIVVDPETLRTRPGFGGRIQVKLPFSGGKLYPEFLINPVTLMSLFSKSGYKKISAGSFSNYLDLYHERPARAQDRPLNADEKEYIGLFYYVVMARHA